MTPLYHNSFLSKLPVIVIRPGLHLSLQRDFCHPITSGRINCQVGMLRDWITPALGSDQPDHITRLAWLALTLHLSEVCTACGHNPDNLSIVSLVSYSRQTGVPFNKREQKEEEENCGWITAKSR